MRWSRIVVRNLRQRSGRSAVSIVAVAIGVTVFLSVSLATRDVRDTIERVGHTGFLERAVSLRPAGVFEAYAPRSEVEQLRALPDVTFVTEHLAVNAAIIADDRVIPIWMNAFGVEVPVVDGRLPTPGADEIAIAVGEHVGLGDNVQIRTTRGDHDVVVTGLLDGEGYTVTSPPTLQRWLGVGEVVSGAVIQLAADVTPKEWVDRHRGDLGAFQVATGFFDSNAVEFFRSIDEALSPLAASTLFVAGYLIFLTLGRAVQDRSRTIATMRALGASRSQLAGLLVGEAAIVGLIGTAIGLGAGSVLSRGVTLTMRNILGVPLASDGSAPISTSVLLVAIALGLITPLLASAIPALIACRADPATHLRGEVAMTRPTSPVRLVLGSAGFVLGAAATALAAPRLKPLTVLLALGGAALALPSIGQPIGSAIGRLWSRLRPGPGELAAFEMARRPGRSAQTSALVTSILVVAVVVATISSSQRPTFLRAVRAHFDADLRVHAPAGGGWTEEDLAALASDPDVAGVSPTAFGNVVVGTSRDGEMLHVIDPASYFDVASLPWTEGTEPDAAIAGLQRGEIALPATIADRNHVDVGDELELHTINGVQLFRVAGLFHGLPWGETVSVVVGSDVARAAFGLQHQRIAYVDLRQGVDAGAWAADHADLLAEESSQIVRSIMRGSDGITNMAYVILVISVLVGVLGLANTLAMDMVDRRHEVGLLRSLGLQRREVRSMVLVHSLVLTIVAGALAVGLGAILGAAFIGDGAPTSALTLPLTYVFPTRAIPAILVAAIAVGALAAVTPARVAGRVEPTESLRLAVER